MYYWKIFITVSFLWVALEIYLALWRRAKSSEKDRGSVGLMWAVIGVSIGAGAFIGFSGYGTLSCCFKTLSALGIIFIITGQIIRAVAIFTLKKYFTTNVAILPGHRLVKNGIYRYIRHPAYAGDLLSFLGVGVGFANWLSCAVIFIPVLIIFLYRIKIEEKALVEAFGDEYLAYCKTTAKLIPWVY